MTATGQFLLALDIRGTPGVLDSQSRMRTPRMQQLANAKEPLPVVPGGGSSTMYVRRRPTLPHRHQCSTIGAEGLSFRVRNGTGRFPFAMTAVTLERYLHLGSQPHHMNQYYVVSAFPTVSRELHSGRVAHAIESYCVSSYRLISTGQLHTLRCFHIRPINPVVSLGASHP
jgi:hypothetical protein